MSVMSRLEIRDLRKSYGRRRVLADVSIDVSAGAITGLLGPNGAGKSTMFKILMGLVPADAGMATLDGCELLGQPLHGMAALGLGYLPQDSCSFPELSVADNLLALLELRPMPRTARRARLRIWRALASLLPMIWATSA